MSAKHRARRVDPPPKPKYRESAQARWCRTANKIAFVSQRIAQREADRRAEIVNKPLYTYRCGHCKDWHMTSCKPYNHIDAREFGPVPEA